MKDADGRHDAGDDAKHVARGESKLRYAALADGSASTA
jgi:hypothetical protein